MSHSHQKVTNTSLQSGLLTSRPNIKSRVVVTTPFVSQFLEVPAGVGKYEMKKRGEAIVATGSPSYYAD